MDKIEAKIRELFEQNYQLLRLEGGHALTEDAKEKALNQVILYWRKLKDIAQKVTDAEIRLSLPNQSTPKGRTFSIEGVVDIVQEGDEIKMYDIKTHDLDYIQGNKELYEEQLNVYAHIWQELRKNKLDLSAVISTAFPKEVALALQNNDAIGLTKAMVKWNPIVPVEIHSDKLQKTIVSFSEVVDSIEDHVFDCLSITQLSERVAGTKQTFATKVCANCDGRFSCDTYREYARGATRGKAREFVKYYDTSLDRDEQEDWLSGNSNFENEESGI
jgi:hypothetical protein